MWNYFQGGLRFNSYSCSPGVIIFKTQGDFMIFKPNLILSVEDLSMEILQFGMSVTMQFCFFYDISPGDGTFLRSRYAGHM